MDKEWKKLETIPAWKLEKVASKKEVILEAHRDKRKVHFASLMDICHLKKSWSWNQNFRSVKDLAYFEVTLSKTTLEEMQRDFLITNPSLQDGHGGIDTQCKEYTFSKSDP